MIKYFLVFLYLIFIVASASGQEAMSDYSIQRFVSPNEVYLQDAKDLAVKAGAGAYVGVGSERAWMIASLNPKVSAIYLTDYTSTVSDYNRINHLLFQISGDRQEYLKYRFHASALDIQLRMIELGIPLEKGIKEKLGAYLDLMRSPDFGEGRFTEAEPRRFVKEVPLKGASYMWSDELFFRIKNLVIQGKVHIVQLDYSVKKDVEKLVSRIEHNGDRIAMFDMSNAWDWLQYLSREATMSVLNRITRVARKTSIVLMSYNTVIDLSPKVLFLRNSIISWRYFGFTLDYMKQVFKSKHTAVLFGFRPVPENTLDYKELRLKWHQRLYRHFVKPVQCRTLFQ